MLSRILTLAAISLVPTFVGAGPKVDAPCERLRGQPANCTPLVGCFMESGVYFTGRAFGWSEGDLAGISSAGFACTGRWTADGPFGGGKAELRCDNGLTGFALFTYQHAESGTVTGIGKMSDGDRLRVWSGHNINQFVVSQKGDVNATLLCGHNEIPIG